MVVQLGISIAASIIGVAMAFAAAYATQAWTRETPHSLTLRGTVEKEDPSGHILLLRTYFESTSGEHPLIAIDVKDARFARTLLERHTGVVVSARTMPESGPQYRQGDELIITAAPGKPIKAVSVIRKSYTESR